MTAELTVNDFRSSESGGVPSRPLSAVRNEDFGVKRDLQPAKPGRGSCLACGVNMIAEARANQWRGFRNNIVKWKIMSNSWQIKGNLKEIFADLCQAVERINGEDL